MKFYFKSIVTGLVLLFSLNAFSLESGKLITIIRVDGAKIEGNFVSQDAQKVVIASPKTGMAQSIQLDHIFKLDNKKVGKQRKFTADETLWLQENIWAETFKKEGDNSYYFNENWEAGRLLVWSNP